MRLGRHGICSLEDGGLKKQKEDCPANDKKKGRHMPEGKNEVLILGGRIDRARIIVKAEASKERTIGRKKTKSPPKHGWFF